MKTYSVVSSLLVWESSANSPEEAHFKAKQFASQQMLINRRGEREWVTPGVFKEISRVFRGRFEVISGGRS